MNYFIDQIYNLEDIDKINIEFINEMKFFYFNLLPNNKNIFRAKSIPLEFFKSYYKYFSILIFPVYKFFWKKAILKIYNIDNIIYLGLKNDYKETDKYFIFTSYINEIKPEFNSKTGLINLKNNEFSLEMTPEAYSFIRFKYFFEKEIILFNLTYLDCLGILQSALKLGIVSFGNINKNSNIIFYDPYKIKPLCEFLPINLKSLYIVNQLKIFKIWLDSSDAIVTGGTGIGKTSQIPKLFWWINFLFDGFEEFNNKSICNLFYSGYEFLKIPFSFKSVYKKKTLLSLPRKILITENSKKMLKDIGYNKFENSPIFIKFKDVKNTIFYNSNPYYYKTPLLISVNRLTLENIKNTNTIIFDEVHEHDLFCDISITIANYKKIQYNIRNIILISATISDDIKRINDFFKNIKHIHIEGDRLFSVNLYSEYEICNEYNDYKNIEKIIEYYKPEIGKSCLFFLSSENKIKSMRNKLNKLLNNSIFDIFILHGKINKKELETKILSIEENKNKISIILTTPIAESSITISNAQLVIDTGKFYSKIFLSGKDMFITQSMREQRIGRVGRVSPGKYVQLYKNEDITKDYKKIDYQYLFPYIVACIYYNIDYKKNLFILPSDLSRFDRTLNYFKSKGIDIKSNINTIFKIMLKYSCNLYEYVYIYMSKNTNYIYNLQQFEEKENIQLSDISFDLINILTNKLNIRCKVNKFFKLTNDNSIYIISFKLIDDYDFYPNISNEITVMANKNLLKYNKYYLIAPNVVIGKF